MGGESEALWPVMALLGAISIALAVCYAAHTIANRQEQPEPLWRGLNGRGTITLSMVTENGDFGAKTYETDDLGEALAAYGAAHLSGGGQNSGPATWVCSFVVERGDARMSRAERVKRFSDLASIESFRATR